MVGALGIDHTEDGTEVGGKVDSTEDVGRENETEDGVKEVGFEDGGDIVCGNP